MDRETQREIVAFLREDGWSEEKIRNLTMYWGCEAELDALDAAIRADEYGKSDEAHERMVFLSEQFVSGLRARAEAEKLLDDADRRLLDSRSWWHRFTCWRCRQTRKRLA